jgi:hypothetical protein
MLLSFAGSTLLLFIAFALRTGLVNILSVQTTQVTAIMLQARSVAYLARCWNDAHGRKTTDNFQLSNLLANGFTANDKKPWTESSRTLKSSTGFANAFCRGSELLTATIQNIKKMANRLDRNAKKG